MNRTPEQWALVKPDAFLDGSIVQARNVIEMMQQDIAEMVEEILRLRRWNEEDGNICRSHLLACKEIMGWQSPGTFAAVEQALEDLRGQRDRYKSVLAASPFTLAPEDDAP